MIKTPTLFLRDFTAEGNPLTYEVNPDAAWVLTGAGTPTRKYDGTCVRFDGERWWARREVKAGKTPPLNWVKADGDDVTGKQMGWEPIEQSGWKKFHAEAVENFVHYNGQPFDPQRPDFVGTYELCGPKIMGNPERFDEHTLIAHKDADRLPQLNGVTDPKTIRHLVALLHLDGIEGVVWHGPDGRNVKFKGRDLSEQELALAAFGRANAELELS